MTVPNLERLKKNVQVDIEHAERGDDAARGSIVVYIPDDGPPRLRLTDYSGTVTSKVVSYIDLIHTLEESVTIRRLEHDPFETFKLPVLPAGLLLMDLQKNRVDTILTMTGVIGPGTILFILEDKDRTTTYDIYMPALAWRAAWSATNHNVTDLSLVSLSPDHQGPPGPDTELYHYPFSHVYQGGNRLGAAVPERVCWPALRGIPMEAHEIPDRAVRRFLETPNDVGHDGKMKTLMSESGENTEQAVMSEIEHRGGVPHDWLTPAAMTIQDLHDQKRRES